MPLLKDSAIVMFQSSWYIFSMPIISQFFGISISMFWDDHNPPHFHAKYGEYEIVVAIQTGQVSGKFPARALGLVQEWRVLHETDLLEDWDLAAKKDRLKKIQPLE